jgi:hypothetical protein
MPLINLLLIQNHLLNRVAAATFGVNKLMLFYIYPKLPPKRPWVCLKIGIITPFSAIRSWENWSCETPSLQAMCRRDSRRSTQSMEMHEDFRRRLMVRVPANPARIGYNRMKYHGIYIYICIYTHSIQFWKYVSPLYPLYIYIHMYKNSVCVYI